MRMSSLLATHTGELLVGIVAIKEDSDSDVVTADSIHGDLLPT